MTVDVALDMLREKEPAPPAPPVVVIGAGAIGGYLAALLARAGHAVHVVARGRRLAQIEADGLRVAMGDGMVLSTRPVAAQAPPAGLSRPLIVLGMKTPDLPAALDVVAASRPHAPIVLTVQNGVEAPAQVAAALPAATVLASRVHGFFEMGDDGAIRHRGVPPSLALGLTAGEDHAAPTRIAAMLRAAGTHAEAIGNILEQLWAKFLLAAPLGTVGAALETDVGGLRADPAAMALLHQTMDEVVRLSRACGVALPASAKADTLAFIASFPPGATTSMQRDLAAGRSGEFDALTGAVLRLAGNRGIAVPVHERLAGAIMARRRGDRAGR